MYGTNLVTTGLTLGKVLSGLSRGLTIANQVIPLYQQAKPMISNARKVMSVLKELNTTPSAPTNTKTTINSTATEKKVLPIANSTQSIPVFFQ